MAMCYQHILKPDYRPREFYQDYIAQGNTAALARIEEDDKMEILIDNLAPGESVKLEFNLILF